MTTHAHDDDMDLVATWLKKDPTRWTAGALGGFTAGLVMMIVAGMFAILGGKEFLFPVKFAAVPVLGATATEFGFHIGALLTGFIVHSVISMFLGAIYAHFTSTNRKDALLAAGLSWGLFGWIFILNLFVQSFSDINAIGVPRGPGLFAHIAWGLALATTGFYDQMLRKK